MRKSAPISIFAGVALLWITWIGAGHAGEAKVENARPNDAWESVYRERLQWWSLQPLMQARPPAVKDRAWPRNDVDRFVLAAMEAKGLAPVPEAGARVLIRRLSFALTGLPPEPNVVETLPGDESPRAYEQLVATLLASPHFGERWARHWLDVVHYSDTHGYEWDAPAKNAWMYRDYVIRAFNADLSIKQFLLEQIAGDLLAPRLDAGTGLNEALIAPMALRLGERRHGDNAADEGVTQEAVANVIDTIGKGFLGTTVACAQCHDHKLDAIAQRDYYALAGVYMSTRWGARTVDGVDPNVAPLAELRRLKQEIRHAIAALWLGSKDTLLDKIQGSASTNRAAGAFPETLLGFWQRSRTSPLTQEEFTRERERRLAANRTNLTLLADFTREDGAPNWRWDGFGMKHGLVRDGELVIAEQGDGCVAHVLPAGRWSHVWSTRLAGALRSPLFDQQPPPTFSIGYAAGQHAAESFILDQAFHCERMKFLNQPVPGWLTLKAGDFDTLEGSLDRARRRVYVELVTKSLNNYFPPRTAYNGLPESELADERSWFGVTRIYQHPPGKSPLDELTRFEPLFADQSDWATRLANLVWAAVERWSRGECDSECVRLIHDALEAKLLVNDRRATPQLEQAVARYRAVQQKLRPDRTVGSAADWNEGRDERVGIRGSYTEFGEEVTRGNIRFLGGAAPRAVPQSSGRLELARGIASDQNPLTARVFVNRVWLHLFGEGLVRTPDDFGHLGEKPSHPELLDYLATRFIEEGWSLKKLVTLLVTSSTWRQDSRPAESALAIDPENRFWHHLPMRRLEAEAIRDSVLAVSGRLDPVVYGPPVDPYRTAQDPAKRLFSGPLDGNGRRSLYTKLTLMEPPRFLALFNQPLPKLTAGRRDLTSVPDQALALLNDPFVLAMARHWSERVLTDGARAPEQRVGRMFTTAFARPPRADETARLLALARQAAALRGEQADTLLASQPAWQDVAHAIINVKEFIYVP